MLHKLDKYAFDNEATKSIFEHFRNVAVASAVLAASLWLQKTADTRSLHGVTALLGSAILGFIAFGLFWIATVNAAHRLRKATNGNLWVRIGFAIYCAAGLSGLLNYAIRQ